MKNKIEIKSIFGNLLFEYECEKNTIKKTVERAKLSDADLRCADLRCVYLRGANLRCANLRGANLRGANLSGADLSGADLSDADLSIYCKWNHSIQNDKIRIGCKLKTIEEWDLFFESDEVYETKRNTQEFKQIQAVYLAYKSYLTHLNK